MSASSRTPGQACFDHLISTPIALMAQPRRSHTIRASFSDAPSSRRVEPLARLEIHTNDLLACVSAITRGLDGDPAVTARLDPSVDKFIHEAARQHEVGDYVIFAVVFRPADPETDMGDAAAHGLLQRDLDPVGEQGVGHGSTLTESPHSDKGGAA